MDLELTVAIPTFICSFLSLVADTIFAVFYFLFPPERHFRQALIVNLLIADWINSLNNTISGAIALSRRHEDEALTAGPACTANGYIGQFSVQAIDFSILVISVAVLVTIRKQHLTLEPPLWQVACVCAVPWIPPLITSNIALGLGAYGPVSGNWCWIEPNLVLRYTLTHGWRILIFVVTLGIYTYVYLYLRCVYGKLHISTGNSDDADITQGDLIDLEDTNESPRRARFYRRKSSNLPKASPAPLSPLETDERPLPSKEVDLSPLEPTIPSPLPLSPKTRPTLPPPPPPTTTTKTKTKTAPQTPLGLTRRRVLRKMLLLNGYPILYIILWIPGIANRIAEIVLGKSPVWLVALQASTQLVGFANALTYAWNEQLHRRVRARWRFWRRRENGRGTVRLYGRDLRDGGEVGI